VSMLPRARSKAPLGLAAFLALPVFFASLMAVSLAIEKPRVVEWSRPHGHLARVFHDPTTALEARIWLYSFVAPLLVVAAGWVATRLAHGVFVSCTAAVAVALALTIRLHRWELHHTARFPYGEDLLPDNTTSSSLLRGEWEHDAANTVYSLVHYTIGLALAAALIASFLAYRRSRAPGPHIV
jgi:hypothetical protein